MIPYWHIVAIAVAMAAAHEAAERLIKRRRFRGRTKLSEEAHRRLFLSKGLTDEDIDLVLVEVSRATTIPRGYLLPSDRFSVELAPVTGLAFDDGVYLLGEVIALKLGVSRDQIDLMAAQNIEGLIGQVAAIRAAARTGVEKAVI